MKLGDFLNTMAGKLNLQQDSNFLSLVSNDALANVEIDDALAGQFDTGLLSLNAAKNSTEIQNHYKPILLKKIDEQFAELASQYGFEAENTAEHSTYNRAALLKTALAKHIAELEKKSGNGDAAKQIAQLQSELQKLTQAKDQEIAQLKAEQAKQILSTLVDMELNGKSYANTELGDTNIVVARTLLNQALSSDGIALVNDNGTIRMKQAADQSLDYYDASHKQVTFKDYVDSMLANKHMLAVSNDDDANRRQQNQHITLPTGAPTGKVDNSKVVAAAAQSLADLDTGE